MNTSVGEKIRDKSLKGVFRFPAILPILVFLFASCGGGGGGSSTPPPTVITDNAASVTQNGAVLNGIVNPNGTGAEAWFEYGINPNLAAYDNTTVQIFAGGSGIQPVDQPLSGLTPGTTYYFRLVASNAGGWVGGEIFSFTTHNPPPAVTTGAASAVTLTGATLNGTVNPNGAVTNAWFEYGEDPTLAVFTATDNQGLAAGRDPVAIETALSGLASGRTYYFRVVAASVEGEVEGAIGSFSTDFPPPAATTGNATGITTSGATFNGTVNPNGFPTEAWFEYGTDNALATVIETVHQAKGSGISDVSISGVPIAPLTPWTTYYFRTVARSTIDPGVFTKGAIRSFPTGEYYVAFGDSITRGSMDDIPGDDVSLDGRNTGGGFEPVLNNLLTAAKGYPHTVVNAGVSGETSADGASRIGSILSGNPSAKYFLILYGTNDALDPAVPRATYKDNMQAIVTAVKNAGKIPYLAKIPYTTNFSFDLARIQEYNAAIDELRATNGITVIAPDFYALFQNTALLSADGLHPNGSGYQSMANRWFNVLP
jgi:lysophospholipase L1-like esterase